MTNDKPDITGSLARIEAALGKAVETLEIITNTFPLTIAKDVAKEGRQALAEIQAIKNAIERLKQLEKAHNDWTMPRFEGRVCRGSYALGTACGRCERCEFLRLNPQPPKPTDGDYIAILQRIVG